MMRWLSLVLLGSLAPVARAAAPKEQECCWCGKPYIRDRSAQTVALSNLTEPSSSALGNMVIRGVLGPVDVRPDRGFYVEGIDDAASLVVVVLHPPIQRQLVMTLALDGNKLPEEDEKFRGEHYEKIRWEVQLPTSGAGTHWLKLPLNLRAGLRTRVHWTLADWPLLRHTGGGKILSKGSVAITVAESLAVVQAVGAVRVVHPPNRTAHLEAFRSGTDTPQPIFPYDHYGSSWQLATVAYGFFANWGGWMGKDPSGSTVKSHSTVGNVVHPVSPFDPGGIDAVERFLSVAADEGIKWEHDMRHNTADTANIVSQIERFKSSSAILSWYISDEPDGAGDHAGAPVGVSPAIVQAAYDAAKQADPYHPVSLSLNCMESARYYAGAADIVMVDVYPIGISTEGCGKTFGCCGCDDCNGQVADVADRVRHVGRDLLGGSRPIGSIVQAFGGEHHWARGPTVAEFRAMSYLGLAYGSLAGLMYWLREEETDPALIEEAQHIAAEMDRLAPVVLRGLPLPRADDDEIAGGVLVATSSGKTKKGGPGVVMDYITEGLHVAGWCNELRREGGSAGQATGTAVRPALELTLLVVNTGSGRRGGVRIVAPSSAQWLEAKLSYAHGLISPPNGADPKGAHLTLQRDDNSDHSVGENTISGSGRLQVTDSIPVPKYGVRLYTVTIAEYVPSESSTQEDGGGCDGWLRDAAAEMDEGQGSVNALKSEL